MILRRLILLFAMLSCSQSLFSQPPAIDKKPPATDKDQVRETEAGKISLKLKNMDIIEVFNILSQKGKLNIITGSDVRGRVTLFLDNVDVWTAFRLVAESNNLAYVREGDVVRVFTDREHEILYGRRFYDKTAVKVFPIRQTKAEVLKATVEGLKSRIGRVYVDENSNAIVVIDSRPNLKKVAETLEALDVPLNTAVYSLKHADGTQMEEKLKPFLSKRGSLQVDAITNKIIVTDVPGTFEVVERLIQEYDTAPFVVTRIFNLKYGKFDQIKEKLEKEITEGIGKIHADERTNKVAITDLPEKLDQMEGIILAFDEKHREVIIEAKIVQVRLSKNFKFGINWEYIATTVRDRALNLNMSSGFELLSELPQADTATIGRFEQRIPTRPPPFDSRNATHPGGRLFLAGLGKGGEDGLGNPYQAVIDALKETGDVNILSSPRIAVLHGEEAKIQVGTNEAYVTSTAVQNTTNVTTAENVNFIQVGVLLKVKPLINEDLYVTMEVEPEVSSVSTFLQTASGNRIPIVRTSNAKTRVMVKDGVTVVIGGLIDRSLNKRISKVPILGSIPILGLPFKRIEDETISAELVIFLTPYIITGDVPTNEESRFKDTLELPKKDERKNILDDFKDFAVN